MVKGTGETFTFADNTSLTRQPHESYPQLLLNWLLQHWTEPTICMRDIYSYAPRSIRDPIRNEEIAISSTQTLVDYGWLIPLKAHRRDRQIWQIARKPIIHPTVPAK
jgi:hypothetical protein